MTCIQEDGLRGMVHGADPFMHQRVPDGVRWGPFRAQMSPNALFWSIQPIWTNPRIPGNPVIPGIWGTLDPGVI